MVIENTNDAKSENEVVEKLTNIIDDKKENNTKTSKVKQTKIKDTKTKDTTKDITKDTKTKDTTKIITKDTMIKNTTKTTETLKNSIKDISKDIKTKEPIKDTKTKDTIKTTKPIKKVNTNLLILKQYYQRYSLNIKARKPKKAIGYFVNIYNHIEKNPHLYSTIIGLFKQNKNILHETVALQGIETILPNKRFKVETFYTLLKSAVNNEKLKINFDMVNEIVQNTDLVKEYKKEFNKYK